MNEPLDSDLFQPAILSEWAELPLDVLWTRWITSIQALGQIGLTFTQGPFDRERYEALLNIAAQMGSYASKQGFSDLKDHFQAEKGYATPKVDVRGAVFQDDAILLVKERADQLWTLPGGWADVNLTPRESVEKEIEEEAGYKSKAVKLLALFDKSKHDHPPQWPYVYKCFFHCEIIGGKGQSGLETSEVGFFKRDELPPLSTHRVTVSQIHRCFEHLHHPDWPTDFD
ncbi:MAG: NUDIX hydrolase [Gammaproteobacteria bacterium]